MDTETLTIAVPAGLDGACADCAGRLEATLRDAAGVREVRRDQAGQQLTVAFDPAVARAEHLESLAREAVAPTGRPSRHEVFNISGMDCPDCGRTIERAVAALPGAVHVVANYAAGTMHV